MKAIQIMINCLIALINFKVYKCRKLSIHNLILSGFPVNITFIKATLAKQSPRLLLARPKAIRLCMLKWSPSLKYRTKQLNVQIEIAFVIIVDRHQMSVLEVY